MYIFLKRGCDEYLNLFVKTYYIEDLKSKLNLLNTNF